MRAPTSCLTAVKLIALLRHLAFRVHVDCPALCVLHLAHACLKLIREPVQEVPNKQLASVGTFPSHLAVVVMDCSGTGGGRGCTS